MPLLIVRASFLIVGLILLLEVRPAVGQDGPGIREIDWKLWDAVLASNLDSAGEALDSGAAINTRFDDGETPLMRSIKQNDALTFELLLDREADIQLRDYRGRTALWYSVGAKNDIFFDILMRLGAEIDDTTDDGNHLVSYAAELGRYPFLRRILDADVSVDRPMMSSVLIGHTPLMLAIRKGCMSCVQLLIERDASLEARTPQGQTPLGIAALSADGTLVRFLIDHEAEVNVQDAYGRTPLMFAVMRECKKDVVRMLLDAGADPALKDYEGETVYTLAKKSNCDIAE
jgi:ankyrin repeat protein